MKKTIIIYLILLNLTCFSQSNSFSKAISPYGNIHSASFVATGIVKQGSNYLLTISGFDTANIITNAQSLYFAKIDSNGNNFEIIKKYVQADTNYYTGWGAFIKTHNEGFCNIGDITSVHDTSYNPIKKHFIMLFDSSMNNILTKIISHDTIWEAINQVRETHDHGYIIVGQRLIGTDILAILIIKTDSMGNQLWRKTLSTGTNSNGWQIEETPDHGFIIEGYNSSYTTGLGGPFLLKSDSIGDLVWIKYLGNSSQHDGGAAFAITKDSNYIVALGYSTYTYSGNSDWLGRINVIKYSPDGTQIWNKMFDTIRADNNINKIQILPNNDFMIMGTCISHDINYFYSTLILKFSTNGDSLWRREYSYSNNYADENYLYDNVLNSDGSITACGYVTSFSLTPTQQIWIMKTDSNGYAPGCEPTGINEIHNTKTEDIRVFPNPAINQTTIAYSQLKEEGDIHIYNMLGQIVYEEKIAKGSSQTKLSIQHLKAGLYKVIVKEKGMIKGEVSLVKE
ncbi:MAG: T9SS type A sorting domain-containing protein [Bacteroidota bacterium]